MHKRGGNRGNYSRGGSWNSTHLRSRYRDHDGRVRQTTGRVGSNNSSNRYGVRMNNYEPSVRAHLLDEGSTSHVRTITRGGRRGERHEGRNRNLPQHNKKLFPGATSLYEVKIFYMKDYSKDFIIETIRSRLQIDSFQPLYFKLDQDIAFFYVDNFPVAEKIFLLDRLITLPNGYRMIIKVRAGLPQLIINDELRTKLAAVFAKRFIPATKALNLSSLHTDPELSDIYCCLARPRLMIEVVNIIASSIPDLEALNLDSNKIHITDHMKCIPEKLPNIKILHLKNNKLSHTSGLDCLKQLPLVELVLDGNPLKEKFREPSLYLKEIRKLFPKLVKLDDQDLPPEISFDLEKPIDLPTPKSSFLVNAGAEDIVRQFVHEYYRIYDSECRQSLLYAYHECAIMSITTNFENETNTIYSKINRNLYRYSDTEARCRTLKEGRIQIVSCLMELPKTQHDLTSFLVDLSFSSPVLIVLSVTGLFKELNGETDPPIRAFHRTMVIVPGDGGSLRIRNDEFCIVSPTPSQLKDAFKAPSIPAPTEAAPAEAAPAEAVPATVPTPAVINDGAKQQLVQQLSEHSKMNFAWSEKCLSDTNWDLQRALYVFTQLNKDNKIPIEAFSK